MKIHDIHPGIVYAYRQAPKSPVLPLVVLAPLTTSALYTDRGSYHSRTAGEQSYFEMCEGQPRPRRTGSPAIGYPAVTLHPSCEHHEPKRAGAIALMPHIGLEEFTTTTSDLDSERSVMFTLLIDPRQVLGHYEDVMAVERQKRAQYEERRTAGQAQLDDIADGMGELEIGYSIRREGGIPVAVELSLDSLLELIKKAASGETQ